MNRKADRLVTGFAVYCLQMEGGDDPADFLLSSAYEAVTVGAALRRHSPNLFSTSAHSREVYLHSTLLNVSMASVR